MITITRIGLDHNIFCCYTAETPDRCCLSFINILSLRNDIKHNNCKFLLCIISRRQIIETYKIKTSKCGKWSCFYVVRLKAVIHSE